MDFIAKTVHPESQRTGCLILGVFENRRLSAAADLANRAADGKIGKRIRRSALQGKVGQCLLLHEVQGLAAERVLLVGCGAQRGIDGARYRKIVARAVEEADNSGARDAVLCLTELTVDDRDAYWKCRQAVECVHEAQYRFDELKSNSPQSPPTIARFVLSLPKNEDSDETEQAIHDGENIAAGVALARHLGNLPANICTPSYLARKARQLSRDHRSVKVRVLSAAEMKRLGMGSLLAVAQGSQEPPKLIVLSYSAGRKNDKPVVLVGKGVTFDSGGISIKPSAQMDEMKFDMCGAASVLGTIKAIAGMKLRANVVGLIPATENLPDGKAVKPGDIVTSMSGQTIEVLNTDAEGRLILCDALTYAQRYQPDTVIDVATLTGACVVALGSHASGLFTGHDPLADRLLDAGNYAGDRAWRMPLWDDYQDTLKSNFADVANVGGREAGAITAACFLSRFTTKYRWAHLDIAGVAWNSGAKKGATGRPVKLLTQFLVDRARKKRHSNR